MGGDAHCEGGGGDMGDDDIDSQAVEALESRAARVTSTTEEIQQCYARHHKLQERLEKCEKMQAKTQKGAQLVWNTRKQILNDMHVELKHIAALLKACPEAGRTANAAKLQDKLRSLVASGNA